MRLRSSCRACHKSHKKCDGSNEEPCSRCQKRNENCVWDAQRKRGPKRKRERRDGADEAFDEDSEGSNGAFQHQEASMPHSQKKRRVAAGELGEEKDTPYHRNPNATISAMPANLAPSFAEGPIYNSHPTHSHLPSITTATNDLRNTITIQILLAGSGSVACIKIPELVHKLLYYRSTVKDDKGFEWQVRFRVTVVLTDSAARFVTKKQILDYVDNAPPPLPLNQQGEVQQQQSTSPPVALSKEVRIFQDEDEWRKWQKIGDEVTHIEMRQESDIMLIAPLSANTLAKIANGICDNLLTCVVRAWDFRDKPMIACPAMNTVMWNSIFTPRHLDVLQRDLGVEIVHPVSKKLACGESGIGALAFVDDILQRTIQVIMRSVLPKKIVERGGGNIVQQQRDIYSMSGPFGLPSTLHLLAQSTSTNTSAGISPSASTSASVSNIVGPTLPPPTQSGGSQSHTPDALPSQVHSSGYSTPSTYVSHHSQYGAPSSSLLPPPDYVNLPPSYSLHSSPPPSHAVAPIMAYNHGIMAPQNYIHPPPGAVPMSMHPPVSSASSMDGTHR